jgi:hypothetical protein
LHAKERVHGRGYAVVVTGGSSIERLIELDDIFGYASCRVDGSAIDGHIMSDVVDLVSLYMIVSDADL